MHPYHYNYLTCISIFCPHITLFLMSYCFIIFEIFYYCVMLSVVARFVVLLGSIYSCKVTLTHTDTYSFVLIICTLEPFLFKINLKKLFIQVINRQNEKQNKYSKSRQKMILFFVILLFFQTNS